MGVCNVTPDSFSDGGKHFSHEDACARVDELYGEGADIVDIGAESTRPGAAPVPAAEQLERVLEVVRYAASHPGRKGGAGGCVSIDTASAAVADACLEAGAAVVNDVSCLKDDALAAVVARHEAALVLMHSRGTQADMRGFSDYPDEAYGDVVLDVLAEWRAAADRAVARGVPRRAIVMDPGLGFAKNARHSAELVRRLGELVVGARAPVLLGASRKSFLTLVEAGAAPTARLGASLAAALFGARAGASILRVHDVRATRQAIDLERLLTAHPAPRERALEAAHA